METEEGEFENVWNSGSARYLYLCFTEQRRRKAQKKKERVEIREDDEEEDMSVPVLEQEELKSNVVAQTVVTSQHLSYFQQDSHKYCCRSQAIIRIGKATDPRYTKKQTYSTVVLLTT